jgi:hypothetical protein
VRSSLLARIAAIALSVMALTMLLAAVLTQQLIQVEYRQELDRLLRQEMTEVRLGLPAELEAARGADGVADAAEVELAVQRYLAHNPGSIRHLTVIQVGPNVFSTRTVRRTWNSCSGKMRFLPGPAGHSPPSTPRSGRCACLPPRWTATAHLSAR